MNDDPATVAADELNRRMARAHRAMIAWTTVAAVAAVLVSALSSVAVLSTNIARTSGLVWGAVCLLAITATFTVGIIVSRSVLRYLKKRWVSELAARTGADPEAIAGLALPLGGPGPSSARQEAQRRLYRRTAVAFALVVVLIAVGELAGSKMGSDVGYGLLMVVFFAAFYRYLGWRSTR